MTKKPVCPAGEEMKGLPKRRRRTGTLFLGALLAVLLLLAPGSLTPGAWTRPTPAPGQARAPDQPVLLGVVWNQSDGPFWRGIEMAVAELNDGGGLLGRPVKVVARIDHSSLDTGLTIAQELAATPGLAAVIGHLNSFIAVPAAGVYERAGLPFLAPYATSPELTARGYRHVFRTITGDIQNGAFLADYLVNQGLRRLAVYYASDAYGRGFANALEDALRERNGDVVDRTSYFGDRAALGRLVETWRAFGVDGVVVVDLPPRAGDFIEGIRRAGYTGPIVGGDGLYDDALLRYDPRITEGVLAISHFNQALPRPETQRFLQVYTHRFGEPAHEHAALAYDAVMVWAEAVRRADSFAGNAVGRALREMRDWPGVTGPFTFDEQGNRVGQQPLLCQVRQGRFHCPAGEPAPAGGA